VHAFEVLADPVRRRILELLASGESTSGGIVEVVQREFGISQPAVSQHLKVLRENGFATVRAEGSRRLYSVAQAPLQEVDAWLARFRPAWVSPVHALEALATEVARGKRARRPSVNNPSAVNPSVVNPSVVNPSAVNESSRPGKRNVS
jgi:DNA-binding transcriptional ArsR family regulator